MMGRLQLQADWLAGFGIEAGLSLPSYKQEGCGKAAFPYMEAILVFAFVMFAWGKTPVPSCVLCVCRWRGGPATLCVGCQIRRERQGEGVYC
jgi:hypothetical protein